MTQPISTTVRWAIFLFLVNGLATPAFGAKPQRVRLSDCFSIESVNSFMSGTSINIYTTMPDGKEKLVGQMDDPAVTVGGLGFGSIDAVSIVDRTGLETRYAISSDGQSMVFYSRWPVGKGADRTIPGIHRYVCGRGDSLLHGEGERVDEFGGAPVMKMDPDKMMAVLHKRAGPVHASGRRRGDAVPKRVALRPDPRCLVV